MHIRPFREGDEEHMAEIAPAAFLGLGLARLAIDKSLPRDAVRRAYKEEARGYARRALRGEPDFAVLVAEEEGRPVGYIVVGLDRRMEELFGFPWGRIISLAVHPDFWGRGIGSALVAEGLKWMRERGVKYAEVSTDQNNIGAIRAYERNGFRVVYSGLTLSQFLE